MKRITLFLIVMVCATLMVTPALSAKHGKGRKALTPTISVVPDTISTVAPAPTVCIEGMQREGKFINVMIESTSYGFMPQTPACHSAEVILQLSPGVHPVTSFVCDYVPPSTLTGCVEGPEASLTVVQ